MVRPAARSVPPPAQKDTNPKSTQTSYSKHLARTTEAMRARRPTQNRRGITNDGGTPSVGASLRELTPTQPTPTSTHR